MQVVCTLCKDTNFSANHNFNRGCSSYEGLFVLCAKILIFQQITTDEFKELFGIQLFVLCAKILIFQQITTELLRVSRPRSLFVLCAKILIFQQITTGGDVSIAGNGCLYSVQRY